jgi:hypothetical protein
MSKPLNSYHRIIPRDFFNEAKLLKCLGQFELCVMEKQCNGLNFTIEFDNKAFVIVQNELDASLSCQNYRVFLGHEEVELCAPYNSKNAYPLIARYRDAEYYVFDSKGKFMPNFGMKT